MFKNFDKTGIAAYEGIILLEIMLAMSLGLLILGFLLAVYQTSQQSLRLQHALYQIQDHANFALNLLTSDIQQAGHMGCAPLSSQLSVISAKNKLTGTANEITINFARLGPALISATRTELYASPQPPIQPLSTVIIADCVNAEAAQVSRVYQEKNRQRVVLQTPLQHAFGKYAEINTLTTNHYFIQGTQHSNPDGTPVYALFGNQNSRRNTELVAGVTAMRFVYTLKQGTKMIDADAEAILDWSRVVGVAIHLTLFEPPFKREAYAYAVLNARIV